MAEPEKRGRRIPVPFRTVVAAAVSLTPNEPAAAEVAARLEALFGMECGAAEEEIKEAYSPLAFELDLEEGSRVAVQRPPEDEARWVEFLQRFSALLDRANYVELSRASLEQTAAIQGIPGLRVTVDFSAYDRLVVFVRGTGTELRRYRKWWWPWRRHSRAIPTHERVVLLARLETEVGLHAKLFRDIPEDDLESLLPGTRFKMRIFDHIKIGGAGGTAIVTFIVRNTALFASRGLLGAFAWPVVILGSLFYLGKTAWGYVRAKDTYRAKLMHELFYQMMDSDQGVISRCVDEAEDEEAKETFLAWAVARQRGPCAPAALWQAVEAHLASAHGARVRFDGRDALAKLRRLRLVRASADGRVRAVPAGTAAVHLAAAAVAAG